MIASKLKSDGIKHLQSYFNDPKDKDAVKEKIRNVSGKTGRYFVEDTLFQQRTSRSNRALIRYQDVIKYNLTYDHLDTFEGGVAVEFLNNDPSQIANVVVNVITTDKKTVSLPAVYNSQQKLWVATGNFPSSFSIPADVNVGYRTKAFPFYEIVDRNENPVLQTLKPSIIIIK